MTPIVGIFHFIPKVKYKQVKWNKVKRDMCKSDSIFPYLQSSTLCMITVVMEISFV